MKISRYYRGERKKLYLSTLTSYYRIYVKNFTVYYVVIPMGEKKIMEVRRLLYNRQDRDRIV